MYNSINILFQIMRTSKDKANKKTKNLTALKIGNETFLLGGRAKRAIEKLSAYSSKSIFIPCLQKRKGTSAYYEFQFCKKALPSKKLMEADALHFREDSLIVYMDDDGRLFKHYTRYLSHPHSPDGSGRFYYAGINYYTKEETETILKKIEKERPPYAEPLIDWLREAAEKYNGFFFFGI